MFRHNNIALKTFDQLMTLGVESVKKGDFQEALRYFAMAVQHKDDEFYKKAIIKFLIAKIQVNLDNKENAFKAYNEAVNYLLSLRKANKISKEKFTEEMGQAFYYMSGYSKKSSIVRAIYYLEKAVEEGYKKIETLRHIMHFYAEAGNYPAAKNHAENAIQLLPPNSVELMQIKMEIGLIATHAGDYKTAATHLADLLNDHAVFNTKEKIRSAEYLAVAYYNLNQPSKSESILKKLNPKDKSEISAIVESYLEKCRLGPPHCAIDFNNTYGPIIKHKEDKIIKKNEFMLLPTLLSFFLGISFFAFLCILLKNKFFRKSDEQLDTLIEKLSREKCKDHQNRKPKK